MSDMRKHLRVLAIAAAITALTAACSSGGDDATADPAETTVGEAAAEAGSAIPEPDADQADALVDELAAILPALGDEPDDTVESSRNLCDQILGEAPDDSLVRSTVVRFDDGTDRVSEEDATAIVDVVRNAEWCA